MLVRGNSKLGTSIWQFSLPAGETSCPGRTELCNDRCYAQRGFFAMPALKDKLLSNYGRTYHDDFAQAITNELVQNKVTICRIHVAGDFYSAEYVKKWIEIVRLNPTVKFFTYTRSWRFSQKMRTYLEILGSHANMRMWWSLDRETGYPVAVPKRVRLAYMAVAIDDIPSEPVNLVFRDYELRGVVQKRIAGAVVCPPENGVTETTCQKCGICWKDGPATNNAAKEGIASTRRIPLPLAA